MSDETPKKGKPRGAPRPKLSDKRANVHHDPQVPALVSLTDVAENWGVTKTTAKKLIERANEGHPQDALPVPYLRVSGLWLMRREVMLAGKLVVQSTGRDREWMNNYTG
jgi:hypothetical protein